ncbi:MAG TPA: amino acid permease [Steroidobacteraceae bacterium]|nr:amino acid permease [Steroidobacteraceae bacterium]
MTSNLPQGTVGESPAELRSPAAPVLLRALGTWDVSLITIGMIVGSAIFIAANIVPREMPQPAIVIALWCLGGLLSLAGVVTYAELGTMFPEAGGQYHFLKEAYGPLYGFLFGWTSFLVIQSGAIAYLAVASADCLGVFLPFFRSSHEVAAIPLGIGTLPVSGSQIGAAIGIIFLSAVNYRGLRQGSAFQNAITVIKVASLVALVAFGLAVPPPLDTPWHAAPPPQGITHGLGIAMIGVLWCYDGWYQATFCAGEIRDPRRSLPRGMLIGTLVTTALYILVNLVYLRALPIAELGRSPGIGEAAAAALFGPRFAAPVMLAIFIAVFGCLSSNVLTAARIYLPMAQDGLFFRALARIHPVHRTPSACIVAQGVWAIVLAFSGSYEQLGTYVIFAMFLFHTATGAALFVLRRTRPDQPRSYRAWGYPWTPIVFILTSLAFVTNTLIVRPIESLWGLLLMALGLPAYLWWRRTSPARGDAGRPGKCIQLARIPSE